MRRLKVNDFRSTALNAHRYNCFQHEVLATDSSSDRRRVLIGHKMNRLREQRWGEQSDDHSKH